MKNERHAVYAACHNVPGISKKHSLSLPIIQAVLAEDADEKTVGVTPYPVEEETVSSNRLVRNNKDFSALLSTASFVICDSPKLRGIVMRKAISVILVVVMATLATAGPRFQDPATNQALTQGQLSNKDVLDMLRSGLATEIVVAKIKSTHSKFDTTPAALAELKSANVSDAVILAMVQGSSANSAEHVAMVEVEVPDGTEIEIQLQNTLSGQEAKVGDVVDFTVMRAVQVNGVTIFERDASARARLSTAKKSGRWGKAGKLEWAMQDVQAVDGNRTPARFTKRHLGDSKGGTVAAATLLTVAFLGPFGLFWGLKKGRPAVIPAGTRYTIFVHGDTTIKGKPTMKTS